MPSLREEGMRLSSSRLSAWTGQCMEDSFGEVFDSSENRLVNGFPALIKVSQGLINLHQITMNK